MSNFTAFTLKSRGGKLNALISKCFISKAFDPKLGGVAPVEKEYEAIWDTGATNTVITAKVAKELGLKPSGVGTVQHAGGISNNVNTYLINVILPNKIRVLAVKVTEAVLPNNTEVLIGMDIITTGDFSITNVGGVTCFSFRIPSVKETDFVKEAGTLKPKNKPSWLKPSGSYKGRKKKRR